VRENERGHVVRPVLKEGRTPAEKNHFLRRGSGSAPRSSGVSFKLNSDRRCLKDLTGLPAPQRREVRLRLEAAKPFGNKTGKRAGTSPPSGAARRTRRNTPGVRQTSFLSLPRSIQYVSVCLAVQSTSGSPVSKDFLPGGGEPGDCPRWREGVPERYARFHRADNSQ
jgi:hypothetical protein